MFSIVIPIKNQFDVVKKCIESVIRHYDDQEIILIDDASDEQDLLQYLKEIQKTKLNWKVVLFEQSQDHSKACTAGIQLSSNENVFLLNSDTILTKNSLRILSDVLDINSNIGVVGPCTSSASGPQLLPDLYQKRFSMSIDEIEQIALSLEQNKELQDIELVNGFCFCIKKSVFLEVGKFDPVLNSYGNEKELLIRIRKAGYRTVWVKGCYVHHFGKMSYSKTNINIGRACKDADNYIMKKHAN